MKNTNYHGAQFTVCRIGEPIADLPKCDTPEAAYVFWRDVISNNPLYGEGKEWLVVLTLNTKYGVTGYNLVSVGSCNEALAHPREIMRPCIIAGAFAFVLMHNHPSGDPSPSDADRRLTHRINEAANLIQIRLLDHVIAGEPSEGKPGFFSFKSAGIL